MAITQIQQRNKVYDYATYKDTIPAAGETLAISGSGKSALTVISIMGDGTHTVEAIIDLSIQPYPTGRMTMYAGATAPDGWLLCDGSAVSRSTYANLFSAISTTWGVGDNSTTFNLPDMREVAPVGIGTRASGVTAHDEYTLAQMKDDQLQGHRMSALVGDDFINSRASGGSYSSRAAGSTGSSGTTTGNPVTDGTNGTPRTGTTTHGKQIGVNYIIKT